MNTRCPWGFRIRGGLHGERRLVNFARALEGYALLESNAEVGREGYLSAFCFADDFRGHLKANDGTGGYRGVAWAPFIWFDIDGESDLDGARRSAIRLVGKIVDEWTIDEDDVVVFFSGAKGFHVGVPTAYWSPKPSADFPAIARAFAADIAARAQVSIDESVYDTLRAFRAPNSRHPKTGLHKRYLSESELLAGIAEIRRLAATPRAVTLPEPRGRSEAAAADWTKAGAEVSRRQADRESVRAASNGRGHLNRGTREFIMGEVQEGERATRLFSAAANLAECGAPDDLVAALLTDAARDLGLPPREVNRQIESGIRHVKGGRS